MRRLVLAGLGLAVPALLAPAAFAQVGKPGIDGGQAGARAGRDVGNDDNIVESFNAGQVFFIIVVAALVIGVMVARRRRREQAGRARSRQVRAAAAEAARDDPVFAPAAVKAAAAALYVDLQRAWSERDDAALERGLGPELLAARRRRLKAFERKGWVSELMILEGPKVDYVGLVNREGIDEDRVTVKIGATLHSTVREEYDEIADSGGVVAYNSDVDVSEYWTLARYGEGWRVLTIEHADGGTHHLDAPLVPLPRF